MSFKEIAEITNRAESTVWMNYRNVNNLIDKKLVGGNKILINLNIINDKRLSILESVVKYLKDQGYRNVEIAKLLGKEQRKIWILYDRVKKKLDKK